LSVIECRIGAYPSPRERSEAVGRVGELGSALARESEPGWGAFHRALLAVLPPTLASASRRPSLPTASRGERSKRIAA